MNGPPLLSVVIPTLGRPALLSRAIGSAIESAGAFSVEVVVVPNGPDQSWQEVAARHGSDDRVVFLPLRTPSAPAARNHGLKHARGTYIRFLDDDDVLYGPTACNQIAVMEATGAEVCSGAINIVNPRGKVVRTWAQPATGDLIAGTLGTSRATLTHAHLYRRDSIVHLRWDETLRVGQDVHWMLQLCADKEFAWARLDEPVGAWMHHLGPRIFRGKHPGNDALESLANGLLQTVERLHNRGGLSRSRKEAAADGLWGLFQKGYMYAPREWLATAAKADQLAPGRTPPSAIYRIPLLKRSDPRVIESILIPIRASHAFLRLMHSKVRRA